MDVANVLTPRLDLVSMSPALLAALIDGRRAEAGAILGAAIPAWWPDDIDLRLLRLRLGELRRDFSSRRWLLRALILRGAAPAMVGHAGFHGPPDNRDAGGPRLEIGYAVFAEFQGRGYATESARALIEWARTAGDVRRFVASVAPDNGPSLAIVRKLGFEHAGEQWDETDGFELVFELAHETAPA